MRRFDCFPINNELDMLECRLTELYDTVDGFVLVEADVTHGGNTPKPLYYQENQDRFAKWADKIIPVVASGLPDDPDAWSREHAQREWIRVGLESVDVQPDDIIFQSDLDEIPRAEFVAYVNPQGFTVAIQDLRCFAVDWKHPEPWAGTVACKYSNITTFAKMRDARLRIPPMGGSTPIPDSGWHLSWLGGYDQNVVKLDSFCHPEIEHDTRPRLQEFYVEGVHVDGAKLEPVDGSDLPRWIMDGHAPANWWRP